MITASPGTIPTSRIEWPVAPGQAVLSDKDRRHPRSGRPAGLFRVMSRAMRIVGHRHRGPGRAGAGRARRRSRRRPSLASAGPTLDLADARQHRDLRFADAAATSSSTPRPTRRSTRPKPSRTRSGRQRTGAGAVAGAAALAWASPSSTSRPTTSSTAASIGPIGKTIRSGRSEPTAAPSSRASRRSRPHPDHAILRTAWVYSPFGKNFVKTMLRLARDRDEVAVVADQHGSPTSALDIADGVIPVCRQLVERPGRDLRGVFHMTGAGDATWAEFAARDFRAIESAGRAARARSTASRLPTTRPRRDARRTRGSTAASSRPPTASPSRPGASSLADLRRAPPATTPAIRGTS